MMMPGKRLPRGMTWLLAWCRRGVSVLEVFALGVVVLVASVLARVAQGVLVWGVRA